MQVLSDFKSNCLLEYAFANCQEANDICEKQVFLFCSQIGGKCVQAVVRAVLYAFSVSRRYNAEMYPDSYWGQPDFKPNKREALFSVNNRPWN